LHNLYNFVYENLYPNEIESSIKTIPEPNLEFLNKFSDGNIYSNAPIDNNPIIDTPNVQNPIPENEEEYKG
jgi:hypothetical protein